MVPPQTLRIAQISVRSEAEATLPTRSGRFKIRALEMSDGTEISAIIAGDIDSGKDVLIRLHSECFTGDVMGSLRCDCREQLERSLNRIEEEGRGIVLYLPQEGRGIGLLNKVRAYALQDEGLDTVDANLELGFAVDHRSYAGAAAALHHLGVQSVRLMSNNPLKQQGLESNGIAVSELVAHLTEANDENAFYLETKRRRCGHLL